MAWPPSEQARARTEHKAQTRTSKILYYILNTLNLNPENPTQKMPAESGAEVHLNSTPLTSNLIPDNTETRQNQAADAE